MTSEVETARFRAEVVAGATIEKVAMRFFCTVTKSNVAKASAAVGATDPSPMAFSRISLAALVTSQTCEREDEDGDEKEAMNRGGSGLITDEFMIIKGSLRNVLIVKRRSTETSRKETR